MNDVLLSLVANTPSASLKLSAAWDGLSTESQMEVLHAIRDRRGLPSDVATKAMASPNAFVRYLAAECVASGRHLHFPKDANGVIQGMRFDVANEFRPAWNAARDDSDPLVNSVVSEPTRGFATLSPETCAAFWALSRPARFRYLRTCDGITDGRDVVALIEYALANKSSGDEVTEVVVEYVNIAKSRHLHGRFALLEFAKRAPGYAGFIREELEAPPPPNSLMAWVEPRAIPTDEEKVHFDLKEPVGVVAHLARQVCLWGAFVSLTIGTADLIRTGPIAPLPFLIALVLLVPPLLKALLIHEVEKGSSFPMSGSATPKRLRWIRDAWRLSWLVIVIVGVGFAAILIFVFGPGAVEAYKTVDLRVLVSVNLGLLLLLMWRVAHLTDTHRPDPSKPSS